MTERRTLHLLTINTGSSSLKAALYKVRPEEQLEFAVTAERIGRDDSWIRIADAQDAPVLDQRGSLPNHEAALQVVFAWLSRQQIDAGLDAVGHRVVHGGPRFTEPQRITDELIRVLRELVAIDPDHLPQTLDAIQAVSRAYPSMPQVACFDTTFHRHMPGVARMYALPRRLWDAGVVRYGFHGLSYEFIIQALRAEGGAAADGRVIIAHLGNGASMAAVRGGNAMDTTMGFTPTGGLMMGTRSGDLDPGVLLYLLNAEQLDPATLSRLVNREAGLLGVSGISGDMHDLLDREATDRCAREAIALFCYQARKFLGALITTLGGLDTLIFTGGIGEHAAPVRQHICAGLEFLGIQVDPRLNEQHASIISRRGSPVTVRVMKTDEDRMIARHTYRLILQGGAHGVSL